MKLTCFALLLICGVSQAAALETKFIPADDPAFTWVGRVDKSNPKEPAYTWPGVYVKFNLTGRSLKVVLNDNDAISKVIVDGKIVTEITPFYPARTNLISTNLDPSKPHAVVIYKRTEHDGVPSKFLGVVVDATGGITKSEASPLLMEFIGDSFTAGYGDLSTSLNCPGRGVWTNTDTYYSWASVVARTFNADCMVNAVSGKGLVLNYGESLPGNPESALPALYRRTLQNDPSSPWDFKKAVPNVVVIFIGLNDFSTPYDNVAKTPDDPTPGEWTSQYMSLVKMLRKKYPGVKFLCMGYPNLGMDRYVSAMVAQQKKKGAKDIEYGLTPALGQSDLGCNWHPNVHGQQIMADAVIPMIREMMGWK